MLQTYQAIFSGAEYYLMVSWKHTEYYRERRRNYENGVFFLHIYYEVILKTLFINLVKLSESIAICANDLSLIFPRCVRPQSRSLLPHKSCSVTFRTPKNHTFSNDLSFGLPVYYLGSEFILSWFGLFNRTDNKLFLTSIWSKFGIWFNEHYNRLISTLTNIWLKYNLTIEPDYELRNWVQFGLKSIKTGLIQLEPKVTIQKDERVVYVSVRLKRIGKAVPTRATAAAPAIK